VICCKDYRYIQATQRFVRRQGVRWYDLKATAGGLRALQDAPPLVRRWIFKDVQLVYQLHGVRRIIIVQHQDCAAYGGAQAFDSLQEERQFHQRQFRRARRLLSRALAGVRVEGFFAHGAPGRLAFAALR
jgi:hypothetical protein